MFCASAAGEAAAISTTAAISIRQSVDIAFQAEDVLSVFVIIALADIIEEFDQTLEFIVILEWERYAPFA